MSATPRGLKPLAGVCALASILLAPAALAQVPSASAPGQGAGSRPLLSGRRQQLKHVRASRQRPDAFLSHDAEPAFDQREILSVGTDQGGSGAIVVEVDDDLGFGRNLHVAVKFAAGSE